MNFDLLGKKINNKMINSTKKILLKNYFDDNEIKQLKTLEIYIYDRLYTGQEIEIIFQALASYNVLNEKNQIYKKLPTTISMKQYCDLIVKILEIIKENYFTDIS